MKTALLILGVGGILCANLMALTVRDLEGRSLEVEVLGYNPATKVISIKRIGDGRSFSLPVAKFDPASQKALVDAAPVKIGDIEAKVAVGKRRRKQEGSFYMVDHEISMDVEVRNKTVDADFPQSDFTILIVGEDTRRNGEYEILTNQTIKQSIPRLTTTEFSYKKFKNAYDSDPASYNIGGEKYHAWIFVVHDGKDKVLYFDSSDPIVRKRAEGDDKYQFALTKLKTGHRGERELVSKKASGTGGGGGGVIVR